MKTALLTILLAATILLPVPSTGRTNAFPNQDKHHAMLRLEDVGPGNEYTTLDDLGKLRAVFHYLEQNHIPFSVAVIPRSKHLLANGQWYEKGIDDQSPDPNVKAFIALLKEAEQHGAVLGMHGYTHQYGTTKRPDNNQDTGTGFEFNIKGAPETATVEYAADKITKSLAAFDKVGFTPGFWETPHYGDTREQEEVFRSYMGILYQPDYRSLRSLKDMNVYETENNYGASSLGSLYIPAPLSYVQGQTTVDNDLARLPNFRGLASMFLHPFLEFPYLEPVKDTTGKPVIQNGLPVYQYIQGKQSYLHQLIPGFEERDYKWVSLYDVVPFSPAHRVTLPIGTKASDIMLGDMSGDGHANVAVREGNAIEVYEETYQWPRNRTQMPSSLWLQDHFTADDEMTLADVDGDLMADLIDYNKQTGDVRVFHSDGAEFAHGNVFGHLLAGYDSIKALDANGDGRADLLLRKKHEVWLSINQNGKLLPPQKVLELPANATLLTGDVNGDKRDDIFYYSPGDKNIYIYRNTGSGSYVRMAQQVNVPLPNENAQVVAGDTNGDGTCDLVVYDSANGIWQVLQGDKNYNFSPIDNLFGPWARSKDRIAFEANFYGNGKADIASYEPTHHVLDLALSFRK